ncbi:hypothetical protein [Microbispora sp. H10830]|uniref:hypothetical protein n=1 Tax=Microbispora sp. H10830 TaxID=2729109 RepID=UPI002175F83C|nr:hypothetical protein [Microbispora sp. H10830]
MLLTCTIAPDHRARSWGRAARVSAGGAEEVDLEQGPLLGLAGFLHGTDVATSGVVHEDADATMSSDDLGHCLVMARVPAAALASARLTPASC